MFRLRRRRHSRLANGILLLVAIAACGGESPVSPQVDDRVASLSEPPAELESDTLVTQAFAAGRVVFWTSDDTGPITVRVAGQAGTILYKFQSAPACGQQHALTFTLPVGTYSFAASTSSGRSWSGQVTATANGCLRMRLTLGSSSSGGGSGGGGNPGGSNGGSGGSSTAAGCVVVQAIHAPGHGQETSWVTLPRFAGFDVKLKRDRSGATRQGEYFYTVVVRNRYNEKAYVSVGLQTGTAPTRTTDRFSVQSQGTNGTWFVRPSGVLHVRLDSVRFRQDTGAYAGCPPGT